MELLAERSINRRILLPKTVTKGLRGAESLKS